MRKFLALLFLSITALANSAPAGPRPAPFELWPPTNDAAPAPYTKAAPAFDAKGKPWKFPKGKSVKVQVKAAETLRTITPYYFGNNVAWWNHHDWFLSGDIVEKAKQSGIRFWRWPGGSSSDNYHWDGDFSWHMKGTTDDNPKRMTEPWAVSNDDFIEFCRRTGSEAIITANFGAARYANPKKAADLAARWVKYMNHEKKFKVRYWEIGNENYGNWEEGTKMPDKPLLNGGTYGKDWKVIAEAMRKADPDIYLGAVAVDKDNGEEWTGFFWWMRDLIPEVQTKADYLILHQYFMWPFDSANNYTNPTDEALFANLPKVAEALKSVEDSTAKYANGAKALPVALTEYNLVNASPEECIQLINGIFTAEVIGESIKAGYVAANFWDWRNGLDAKLKGDHAVLSTGDPAVPDGTPRPSYYAFALTTRAFGDKLVASESSDPKVKAYASKFSGGELGLVLANETNEARTVEFDLAGASPKGQLMGWVLTGKSMDAKQVSWNGVEGPQGGGGPFPIDTIPAYRASFDPKKPLSLPVPPNSLCGVIIY